MTARASRRRCLHASLAACLALVLCACATPSVLYDKASRYSRIIVTEDDRGLRTLLFEPEGRVRQSVVKPGDPDHLELPYAKVAMVALAMCEAPRRILVVGLGGGTLPSFLRRHYPEAAIDVVEIDPDIVEVAKTFFGFREDERMRVHVADGREFIERIGQPRYDVIFLDAFGAKSVPPRLTTEEFLQAVRRAVMPEGVVVGNLWRPSDNPLYDSMVRTYQEVFDDLFVIEVAGDVNNMLFALPRRQPISQAELARRARAISAAGQFRFDLGDLVEASFIHAQAKEGAGRVLRDTELAPPR